MNKYTVLICEDNKVLCEGMSAYLTEAGLNVIVTHSGETALEQLKHCMVDVVLLDIMLPGIDGYEVCRRIRKFCDVYIIMLSAKGQELDRVVGLEVGADDYVAKPFSLREITIRISKAMARLHPDQKAKKLMLAELTVCPDSYQVFVGNEEIHLSSKEFTMLTYLISNAGKVLTREQILDAVWNFGFYGDTRVVDGIIKRLRKKLAIDGVHFSIQTVYGIGYKLIEETPCRK